MDTLITRLWSALRHPVPRETRDNLRRLWAELPPALQHPGQLYGKQWEGCGATIGAMPRCDFGCSACYLGPEANSIPPLPLAALREQLRLIRARVGRHGNVQLTDGEVVLRPLDEVLELVRVARELELQPMLMTHGDAFRKDPELLRRLVVEGGLSEISLHVDTTQRGRAGVGTRHDEAELHSVRAELAELVRDTRRRTGRELRVASTVTVTRSNLRGVAEIVRWMLANSDVFRIVSFQPVADVGRGSAAGEVTRAELWREIAAGLDEPFDAPSSAFRSAQLFGHPACTHVVMGAVWSRRGRAPRFVPLRDPTDARSEADLAGFFERFGGLSLRADSRAEAGSRLLGTVLRAPGFWLARGPRWVRAALRRIEPNAASALLRLATGRGTLRPLALVSHHFMDRATLETPEGVEREAACVFRVPYRGELVSMCRVNAAGLRGEQYARQAAAARNAPSPAGTP